MNNSYQTWLTIKQISEIVSMICIETIPNKDPIPEDLIKRIVADFRKGVTPSMSKYEYPLIY